MQEIARKSAKAAADMGGYDDRGARRRPLLAALVLTSRRG
jgi:hypothetical protein